MDNKTIKSHRHLTTAGTALALLLPVLISGSAAGQTCQGQCDGRAVVPASAITQTSRASLAARLHDLRRRRERKQDLVQAVGIDFVQNVFRAQDGTVYQLLRTVPIAAPTEAEEYRITQVAGGPLGLQSGAVHGRTMSTSVGADPRIPQILHAEVLRTRVIVASDVREVRFASGGAGRLTLGTGVGAAQVCTLAADCPSGESETLVPLTSSDGGVPPACIGSGVSTSSTRDQDAWAFGLPADNGRCQISPTTNATLCDTQPTDGIVLRAGQAIVFVYGGGLGMSDFTVGAAGFGIDTDNANIGGCQSGQVVSSIEATAGVPGFPFQP